MADKILVIFVFIFALLILGFCFFALFCLFALGADVSDVFSTIFKNNDNNYISFKTFYSLYNINPDKWQIQSDQCRVNYKIDNYNYYVIYMDSFVDAVRLRRLDKQIKCEELRNNYNKNTEVLVGYWQKDIDDFKKKNLEMLKGGSA